MRDFIIAKEYETMPADEAFEIAHDKITEDVTRLNFNMVEFMYARYYEMGKVE